MARDNSLGYVFYLWVFRFIVNKTLTANKFQKELEGSLIPKLTINMRERWNIVFQKANTSCYFTKITVSFQGPYFSSVMKSSALSLDMPHSKLWTMENKSNDQYHTFKETCCHEFKKDNPSVYAHQLANWQIKLLKVVVVKINYCLVNNSHKTIDIILFFMITGCDFLNYFLIKKAPERRMKEKFKTSYKKYLKEK